MADGDGAIGVPRNQAEAVAKYAKGNLEGDKAGSRKLYQSLGLADDPSVK